MKKILIYPETRKYLEAHFEYLIRYLGNEYLIEQEVLTNVPWGHPSHFPAMKYHDGYDLLIPHFTDHISIEEKYRYKIAQLLWDINDPCWPELQVVAGMCPGIEKHLDRMHVPYHSLRLGIDTELFKPYSLLRDDGLVHIGFVGEYTNPRRNAGKIFEAFKDMPGTKFDVYAQFTAPPAADVVKMLGGIPFLESIVSGGKLWPGIPNCYNRIDILLRLDSNFEYGFPVLEAAACGVPSVCVNNGNQDAVIKAGGAIGIDPSPDIDRVISDARNAVYKLQNDPELRKQMGIRAREEIVNNWTWPKFLPAWCAFLDEGLRRAGK